MLFELWDLKGRQRSPWERGGDCPNMQLVRGASFRSEFGRVENLFRFVSVATKVASHETVRRKWVPFLVRQLQPFP